MEQQKALCQLMITAPKRIPTFQGGARYTSVPLDEAKQNDIFPPCAAAAEKLFSILQEGAKNK